MIRQYLAVSALVGALALCSAFSPAARAQPASGASVEAPGSTSKQAQKAQRKAERQARRAKKNAELSELEKHGYNPAKDQTGYPQDLHNAQQKLNAEKKGAKPASAP